MEAFNENNFVEIGGIIIDKPEFSHELFDEKFYKVNIESKRLSGSQDILPVIVSERLIDIDSLNIGNKVHVVGQFRSYNKQEEVKSKLILSIFAKEIENIEEELTTLNNTELIGFICKKPIYRKTPLGREIADVLIAVNRSYKKSDYIPCILWGRNAKFCEKLEVGTMVKIAGRIQSRKYEKKLENGETLEKVAYEVSVSKFSVYKEEKEGIENAI
ncbi:MAG: single-stranded DNA-binding protein [Clostridia bacterium]|nr:single-stranded DNA-binding protein [Clostridia bacterium]